MKNELDHLQKTLHSINACGYARALLGTLLLAGATLAVGAEEDTAAPAVAAAPAAVTLANFAGKWQATVFAQTGCGISTYVYQVTIPASGLGTATGKFHSAGCGDSSISTVSFHIDSVAANGSGTGGISCGAGCGWGILVQLAPNHQVFNLVDVDPTNPGNFIEGTAIKQ